MFKYSIILAAAFASTSAFADGGSTECETLTSFFELYQEKARVADADLMRLLADASPTDSDESEFEAKLREKGYDPDKLVADAGTIRSYTTLMRDRCGK